MHSNSSMVSSLKSDLGLLLSKIVQDDAADGEVDTQTYNSSGYTVQIYNSSDSGISSAYDLALKYGLSTLNFSNCEAVLKKLYNIPSNESLLYYKIDYDPEDSSNTNTSKIQYKVFDNKGQELNTSYCSGVSITISVPITNGSGVNVTQYEEFSASGIDIYDTSDNFYNDICFTYNTNGTDMTLQDRRTKIYKNISSTCTSINNQACNYSSIINNTYIDCSCDAAPTNNSNSFVNQFLTSLTGSNFMVITCWTKVTKAVKLFIYILARHFSEFRLLDLFCNLVSSYRNLGLILSK